MAYSLTSGLNVITAPPKSSISCPARASVISIHSNRKCRETKHALPPFLLRSLKRSSPVVVRAAAESAAGMSVTEKSGIKVVTNPPESKLVELGVRSWPKWGCPPSKFPWTYSAKEICYLLKGRVKVTPNGSDEAVEIAAGDLVEFPKGMSCTWDVSETVDKHYTFD